MSSKILENAVTGKIQNELLRLGYKCRAACLAWFTDKPFHSKSEKSSNTNLTEPYLTSLGYKTACKLLDELRGVKNAK